MNNSILMGLENGVGFAFFGPPLIPNDIVTALRGNLKKTTVYLNPN